MDLLSGDFLLEHDLSCRRAVWKSQWPLKEASRADQRTFQRVKERMPMPQRKLKLR